MRWGGSVDEAETDDGVDRKICAGDERVSDSSMTARKMARREGRTLRDVVVRTVLLRRDELVLVLALVRAVRLDRLVGRRRRERDERRGRHLGRDRLGLVDGERVGGAVDWRLRAGRRRSRLAGRLGRLGRGRGGGGGGEVLGRGGSGQVDHLGDLRQGRALLALAVDGHALRLLRLVELERGLLGLVGEALARCRLLKLRQADCSKRRLGGDDGLERGEVAERRAVLRGERLRVEVAGRAGERVDVDGSLRMREASASAQS